MKKGLIVQGCCMQGPKLLKLKAGSCGSADGSSLVVIDCFLQPKGRTEHDWLFASSVSVAGASLVRQDRLVDEDRQRFRSKVSRAPTRKPVFGMSMKGRKSGAAGETLDRAEDDVAEAYRP